MVRLSNGLCALLCVTICSLMCARAKVTYKVYPKNQNPTCDPNGNQGGIPGETIPDKVAIGTCLEFGKGKSAYNSIKVLGCSSKCLCFLQVAGETAEAGCDVSKALGSNIKEACFDKCMPDCNGDGCGSTTTVGEAKTLLTLLGDGQICAEVKSDAKYSCNTTGMVSPSGAVKASSYVLLCMVIMVSLSVHFA